MLYGLFREELPDLLARLEKLERRLHDAVEEEGEVHQEGKAGDLQPLERLPLKTQRDDPNEEGPARVDGGSGRCADAPRHGQAEEVEAAKDPSSVSHFASHMVDQREKGCITYPMLIMMRMLETPISLIEVICRQPSDMSK